MDAVNAFFRGTDVQYRQQSLWPYNFGVIPIGTDPRHLRALFEGDGEGGREVFRCVLHAALIRREVAGHCT